MMFRTGDILENKKDKNYKIIIDEIFEGKYFINMVYRNSEGKWKHTGKGTRYKGDHIEQEFKLIASTNLHQKENGDSNECTWNKRIKNSR